MADAFGRALEAIVSDPLFARARIGVAIHDLDEGSVLFERDADAFFSGASTTKLFTVANALARLGSDFRFRTVLRYTGRIADGRLDGDLILVASGDPNLSARVTGDDTLTFCNVDHAQSGAAGAQAVPGDPLAVLRKLARGVAERGIRHVSGGVYVDVSLFPEEPNIGSDGSERSVSPLVINDNLIDVVVSAGREPHGEVRVAVSPDPGDIIVANTVRIAPADALPDVTLAIAARGRDGTRVLTLSGTLPAGATQLYSFAVDAPSRHGVELLTRLLADEGVAAGAQTGAYTVGLRERHDLAEDVLAEHISPPFSEAAKVTLKLSNNLHAQLLPRIVGAVYGSTAGPQADSCGFTAEADFLDAIGAGSADALQADASGGLGLFTPGYTCRFLRAVAALPIYGAFRAALPTLGVDGTLHDVQVASPAAGHVHAKTGTLSFPDRLRSRRILVSKALAGYIDAASGRRLVFAAYVNNAALASAADIHTVGEHLGRIATDAYEAF